jgi:hypothetical protein
MRKLALALMLALASLPLAEESKEQADEFGGTGLGIRAGVHLMTMGAYDWSAGWHIGAVRDVSKIASMGEYGGIYLQPGLLFFTKTSWSFDTQTYWFEVPVLLSIKYKLFGRTNRLNVGPYFNFGIFGDFENKITTEIIGQSEMNRFDLGLSVGTGTEFGRFWVGASYNYGFINVSDYYDYNSASIKFTLGWNM